MKKFIALSLGALAVLASVSCRRDSATPEEAREALRQPVTVTASMDAYQVKATDVSFEDGDAIGVFALDPFDRVNVRGIVSGSSVNLATPIPWELVSSAVFLGYYPYEDNIRGVSWTFSVRTDQRTFEDYKNSDLRSARTTARHGETVDLSFRHRLSKLTVSAVCEDVSDEVTAVTIGGVVIEAKVDIAAATAEAATNRADIKAGKAVSGNGNTGFVAILVPQTLSDLPLTVTTKKGQTLSFHPENPLTFEEGYAYTAGLRIPKTEPSVGEALTFSFTVTEWSDGDTLEFQDVTDND